ncbi:MAG: hypothetical protein NVSMB2_25090 [Chloroflexota bacterium]
MSALDLLRDLSWLLYLIVFGTVALRTARRPTRAHLDITLFFGATAVVILLTTLTTWLHVTEPHVLIADINGAAAVTLGYLLLRLVQDFGDVPELLARLVQVGLALALVAVIVFPSPVPPLIGLLLAAYISTVMIYDTVAFARYAGISRGVTRRRMEAAALGSLLLAVDIVIAGIALALPDMTAVWDVIGTALGLFSGVAYFLAFAPPTWLRRAWQEPELRHFLSVAASLPRLPDTPSIVHELERTTAAALGASAAAISLWRPEAAKLRVYFNGTTVPHPVLPIEHADSDGGGLTYFEFDPALRPVSGRAFLEQRAVLMTDAARIDPSNAGFFEELGLRAALSAPITAGERRLGVLVIYAPRAPVFANSDLELVQLLADQSAVVLESRGLIEEAARVRAREEAARLKEDFLSSAAHDLKTPLTGLLTQAQLLDRRAQRAPNDPVDRVGLARLVQQSRRLRDLVLELLDVSRLEQGSLIGERQALDLGDLLKTMVEREPEWERVKLEVVAGAPLIVSVDLVRFEQVITNLVENALKYSPHDAPVRVSARGEGRETVISVADTGIGVPRADQSLIFERFHRGRNVDDRRFAGMGLGLYIARGIVQEHGGRIWVESQPGDGSTFFVSVPNVNGPASLAPVSTTRDDQVEERLASA